jgi:hypothetical protein
VWTDSDGLHLRVRRVGDQWYSAEVSTVACTTHGRHCFQLVGRPDLYDPNLVLGLFLYRDDLNELDIEFARWGVPDLTDNVQYVVQPGLREGNLESFPMALDGPQSTHTIHWAEDEALFSSTRGHDCAPPDGAPTIHRWAYRGKDIPPDEGCMRVHINLWLDRGRAPSDGREAEIVIRSVQVPPSFPSRTTLYLPLVHHMDLRTTGR